MDWLWHWILYVLAAVAADPVSVELEHAKSAGAVNVAYASLLHEPPPKPHRPIRPKCEECDGSGKIYRPDGGYVRCKCGACPAGACSPKVLP